MRDGARTLPACLDAVARSRGPTREIVVADDGSTDGSGELAAKAGARVVQAGGRGPAAARNAGAAAARGDVLLFLDADCAVHEDAFAVGVAALERPPRAAAVFGSYDDDPPGAGLASQFKNLHHHWIHQRGEEQAQTFWSGCGLVRAAAFRAVGGFDERRFPRPSIEDVELGQRLCAAGHRIRLEKRLQVTHLKTWSLKDVVLSDVRDRAAPWAELLLERRGPAGHLNLASPELVAGALGLLVPPALPLLRPDFYRFLARRRGARFALAAWPLHWLYFASGAVGAALGAARFLARRAKRKRSYS